jgi:hypothetical protein
MTAIHHLYQSAITLTALALADLEHRSPATKAILDELLDAMLAATAAAAMTL